MRICNVEGCNKKHHSNGYCKIHWRRWYRHGDPLFTMFIKHGMGKTSEYSTWACMKSRCSNKNDQAYKNYGGRGITVCDRWRNSFLAFLEDMGPRPFPKATIDRIDNDGNYEPNNCRWVTWKTNIRNSRTAKLSLEKANEIRKLYATGKYLQRELAGRYSVSGATIGYIIRGKFWAE